MASTASASDVRAMPSTSSKPGRPLGAGLIAGAGVAFTLLALELVALALYKVDIQSRNCWLPAWLTATFPLGPEVDVLLSWWHLVTNSFIYMQLSFLVASIVSFQRGASLYGYIIIAHVIKNFSKSFIASPRGFWFCTEGHAISCGGGYSLPSGHSMMSLALSLYVVYHASPRWRPVAAALAVLYEVYTVFEITYLGTHTLMDVLVGFTFAVCYFLAYVIWQRSSLRAWWQRASVLTATALMVALTALTYYLETLEEAYDRAATHPLEWQNNYESYCRLKPNTAAHHMRNSSAYEKTALLLGLTCGLALYRLLRVDGWQMPHNWVVRAVLAAAGFYVFTNSKRLLNKAAVALIGHQLQGYWRFGVFFFQPLFLLALYPLILRVLGAARPAVDKPKRE